jgi:hypothetical protein
LKPDDGFFTGKQSGGISQLLNKIPGKNAVAQFHDTLFSPNSIKFNLFSNVITMLPAAGVTFMAISDSMVPNKKYR